MTQISATSTKRERDSDARRRDLIRQLQIAESRISPEVKVAANEAADRYHRTLEKLAAT